MSVGRICVREVHLADPEETAYTAAHRMLERNVGTLVVLDRERRPIGLVTDRDLALRVLARDLDADATRVADVMTTGVLTVREDTPIEDALAAMRSGPYRRIVVVDAQDRLVGLLSVDDLLDLLSDELRRIADLVGDQEPRWPGAEA